MLKLTISIVTWNSAETIYGCIQSVLNQSFRDYELFIFDNDSKDNTVSIVESFNDKRIRLTKNLANLGFCGGHNFNIENSHSEFVLLVNPDIILQKEYVSCALDVINEDQSCGTVCGLLLQSSPASNDSLIDSAGLEMRRSRIMKMRFHGKKRSEVNLKKVQVFGADGALPLYRRAMINDISYRGKFFDEMFFAHKEDWDISWRASIFGWNTIFTPECIAVHPRHFKPGNLKVRSKISETIKFHTVKNQIILLLKNESSASFFINLIYILPRQVAVFIYILLFERASLQAYKFIFDNYAEIIQRRRVIQRLNKK